MTGQFEVDLWQAGKRNVPWAYRKLKKTVAR
jgi:hypothetical protein